jgi:hypothetical protein
MSELNDPPTLACRVNEEGFRVRLLLFCHGGVPEWECQSWLTECWEQGVVWSLKDQETLPMEGGKTEYSGIQSLGAGSGTVWVADRDPLVELWDLSESRWKPKLFTGTALLGT